LIVFDFSKKFNEFLRTKKEQQQQQYQTMAIIYCQYPLQIEMKISFFGLKIQVNLAKKQLKMLIYQHRMQTIRLEFDSKQVSKYVRRLNLLKNFSVNIY
jgi:hypothetical protein